MKVGGAKNGRGKKWEESNVGGAKSGKGKKGGVYGSRFWVAYFQYIRTLLEF
jgi:hypothetical protein